MDSGHGDSVVFNILSAFRNNSLAGNFWVTELFSTFVEKLERKIPFHLLWVNVKNKLFCSPKCQAYLHCSDDSKSSFHLHPSLSPAKLLISPQNCLNEVKTRIKQTNNNNKKTTSPPQTEKTPSFILDALPYLKQWKLSRGFHWQQDRIWRPR